LGSPAIIAWQSGRNRIAQNTVHDVPYSGICVSGRQVWDPRGDGECSRTIRWTEVGRLPAELEEQVREPDRHLNASDVKRAWNWHEREPFLHARHNRIERNDIYQVMQTLGDGNAIYLSGAGAGNVVRENYVHHCDGPEMNAALRCDGDQQFVTFERNIVFRTGGFAEGIINKGENHVLENLIIDLRPTNRRHRGYLVFTSVPDATPPFGAVIQRNVFVSATKGQLVTDLPKLRQATVDYNLYHSTEEPEWGQKHLDSHRPHGIETHSIAADPLFVDWKNGNFQFRPDSPALKLGLRQPFDVRQAGVQREDHTAPAGRD
jgi:hypothetical protein